MRCTQATLKALGFDACPQFGTGVLEQLQSRFIVKQVAGKLMGQPSTVAAFIKAHPTGHFYIMTNGHAMALIDGKLTDTTGCGADRRHILCAWSLQ